MVGLGSGPEIFGYIFIYSEFTAHAWNRPYPVEMNGRGGAIRTPDPLRPRQVRYQAALRPDILCFLDFKPLSQFPIPPGRPKSTQKPCGRGKTVTKPHQLTFP